MGVTHLAADVTRTIDWGSAIERCKANGVEAAKRAPQIGVCSFEGEHRRCKSCGHDCPDREEDQATEPI